MSGRGSERILDIIEWLAARSGSASLTELVQSLELPKSSTLLLLRVLVDRRYVERLDDGRYQLVRLPGEISEGREAWGTVLRVADPFLREAVTTSQETGCVAVMENFQVRYLNKLLPTREVRYDRDISRLRIPHQVASGIVLLSGVEDPGLHRYSECHSIADDLRQEIVEMVDTARRDGFFVNLKGVVEGAAGVAAPVFDAEGRIIAAANVSGPKDRFFENRDAITAIVIEAARRITEEVVRRTRNPRTSNGRNDNPWIRDSSKAS